MSKATAVVEMAVTVTVVIDGDGVLSAHGRRDAPPGANEPFDRDVIKQWLRDEFSLWINDYETENIHGYMRVCVDWQTVEDVQIEDYEGPGAQVS